MRTSISQKPALVRYVRLVVRWIGKAWAIYRLYEMVMALVDVV